VSCFWWWVLGVVAGGFVGAAIAPRRLAHLFRKQDEMLQDAQRVAREAKAAFESADQYRTVAREYAESLKKFTDVASRRN
jgi:hypothetical protein